METDLKIF